MVRHRPPKKKVQGSDDSRVYHDKKIRYFKQANSFFDMYDKMLVVSVDNVQSRQMQNIRIALRGHAHVLMGKNTMINKVLLNRVNETGSERDKLMYSKIVSENLLYKNVGLILTNGDLTKVIDVIETNRIQAPARQGAIAPLDVTVPAGNTGLEPTKTSFFQALDIQTKITKGTVEILKDELVIKEGEKVGSSEATLLQMLGINPFYYGMIVMKVYDCGSVYDPEILTLTDDDMKMKFQVGVSNVTGLSLGSGYTTSASMPHVLMNAFKSVLGLSIASDYTFDKGAELKQAVLEGRTAGPAVVEETSAAPKKEVAKVEEEEEEEEEGMFGLFD